MPACSTPFSTPGAMTLPVPTDEECFHLWDEHAMPAHIREHSQLVADMATALAQGARDARLQVPVRAVRASALLHDLAKAYTIAHGGNHSQIGAAWVVAYTGNPLVAQGILHHVFWPYGLEIERFFLPLAVLYADKRVRHHELVSVEERFHDLFERYGVNREVRDKIQENMEQTLELEERLSAYIGVNLGERTLDCGRLVPRA